MAKETRSQRAMPMTSATGDEHRDQQQPRDDACIPHLLCREERATTARPSVPQASVRDQHGQHAEQQHLSGQKGSEIGDFGSAPERHRSPPSASARQGLLSSP
eukprot:scaffold62720_cov59-Phaeocystis_antarctica.AAC.3